MRNLFKRALSAQPTPARECEWCGTGPCHPTCGVQVNPAPALEMTPEQAARAERFNTWGVTR